MLLSARIVLLLFVIFVSATTSSIIVAVVDAASTVCAGACASSLFNTSSDALCTQANITLSVANAFATSPPTLVGTSVYRFDTNLELASIHAGFAIHGQTNISLYLYFMGQMASFWQSTRFGLKSNYSVSATNGTFAGYGFLLSNVSGACPTNVFRSSAANSTNSTNSSSSAFATGTVTPFPFPLSAWEQGLNITSLCSYSSTSSPSSGVIGSGYYHPQSDVSCILDLEGITAATPKNTSVVTSSYYYLHDVGFRSRFFPTALISSTKGRVKTGYSFPLNYNIGVRAVMLKTESDLLATSSSTSSTSLENSTFSVQVDLTDESILAITNGTVSDAISLYFGGNSAGKLFGTNPFYTTHSSVAAAAWHAGCAIPGTVQTCWISPQPEASRFYSSGMNSVESFYFNTQSTVANQLTYGLMGGYSVSRNRPSSPPSFVTPPHSGQIGTSTPNGKTTIAYLAMDRVIRSSLPLVGTSVYTTESDVQKAAFHSGTRTLFQGGDVYIHEVSSASGLMPPMLFGLERQGVVSEPLSSTAGVNLLFALTPSGVSAFPSSSVVSKNVTKIYVQPKFYKADKVVGAGYYSVAESDLLSCVLHSGLATFGERKAIYVTFVGTKNFFYQATNGPFASRNSTSPSLAFVLSAFAPSAGYFVDDIYPVYLSATDLPNLRPVVGTSYYTRDSDLTGIALHQRLLTWQQSSVLLFIHAYSSSSTTQTPDKQVFLGSTSSQIKSEYRYYAANQSSIFLSTSATKITNPPRDPSHAQSPPLKVPIRHELLLPGNNLAVGGARVYQAATTDLRVAAVLDDLVTLHGELDLFVHWIPSLSPSVVPCFPATSNLLSASNASGTPLTGPFFILSNSSSASSVSSDVSLVLNRGIFKTRVLFSPSKNRRKIVGTHYYRFDSDIATAAVHSGVINAMTEVDVWKTVYVHLAGTVPYFFGSGGSGELNGYVFSEASAQAACSFRVSSSSAALAPMDFANFGPIRVRPEYFAPIYGTNFYTFDSDITTAALHSRLAKYNESKSVYVKVLSSPRTVFYSSTVNDIPSAARYSASTSQKAFVLSLDGSAGVTGDSLVPPASATVMAVQLRLLNIPRIPTTDATASATAARTTTSPMPPTISGTASSDGDSGDDDTDFLLYRKLPDTYCIGAGYYDVSSDLTLAAVHNGLLRVGELKTLYVHAFPGRTAFVGAESRGVFCLGRKGVANATIVLSESPSVPSWYLGTNVQVANISARQKTCPEDVGGSNAPAMQNPYPTLYGFGRFDLDGTASGDLAAIATGAVVRGVPKQVYFWTFPAGLGFVPAGTGLGGISSVAKFTSSFVPPYFLEPLSTFEVTTTPTPPPASGSFTVLAVTVTFPGYDALPNLKVWGVGGVYHYRSDVVGAAIHSGLLTSKSGPVTLWIHFSKSPVQSFIAATSFGVTSRSCVDCYAPYFIISNVSSPAPSLPAVRSAKLKWTSIEHAANATQGYFGCYPYSVDASYAAMKEGLIPSPSSASSSSLIVSVYFHEFSNKYAPGVTSGPTSCYIPSLSASPPISHAIPLKIFGSGPVSHLQSSLLSTSSSSSSSSSSSAAPPRKLVGTDRYTLASDVFLAAFHLGLIKDGEEAILYLHVSTFDFEYFFASTRYGISSASDFSDSQRAFTLTTSPVPAAFADDMSPFRFDLQSSWIEQSFQRVTGTGIYTQSSDLTFAAAHSGLFRFSSSSSSSSKSFTVYVHLTGTRTVFLSSVFDGVRSEYLNNGTAYPAMILSSSSFELQACATESTDTFYAPLRGANPKDGVSWLSVLADGVSFSGNSDVARAAAYTGIVSPYTLRFVKVEMTFYSGASGVSFTNVATGNNSITPVALASNINNVSFRVSLDTSCFVVGWPGEVTSLAATPTCSASCAVTLFPLGPMTPLGTTNTVAVAADSFSKGESLDGTGAYSLWSDVQKAVVHSGLLYPGDVGQVTLVYVGEKNIFGSAMRGVTSYGAPGGTRYPCFAMYLASTGGGFSYDPNVVGPVNMSFSQYGLFKNMSLLKGTRIYKHEAISDVVAAAYHTFAVSQNGTYGSEQVVYIHSTPQQRVFLSSTVGSGCTQGENVTAQYLSALAASATAPFPPLVYPSAPAFAVTLSSSPSSIPSNMTTKLRFPPISLWSQCATTKLPHVGAGVYPFTSDLVVDAVQSGYLKYIHESLELNVTDVGVVGSFWGHYARGVLTVGMNNSASQLGGIVLSINREDADFTATIIYNVTELVAMNVSTTTTSTSTTSSTTTTSTSTTSTTASSAATSTTSATTTNASAFAISTTIAPSTTTATTNATSTSTTPAPPPAIVFVNVTKTLTKQVQLLPINVDFADVPEAIRVGAVVFGTPEAYSPTSNMLLAAAHSADPATFVERVNAGGGQIIRALALPYFPKAIIHSQRRNSIISRALAATSFGGTLDTVRVEFSLPAQPYLDRYGPYASQIDLGGSLLDIGKNNASEIDQGAANWLFGTGVYSSDSEIGLASSHSSAGLSDSAAARINKVCAYAAPPQTRSENAIPGAVGPNGVRSCSTTVINVQNSTSNAGRFTLAFGDCDAINNPPAVSPTATRIAFNLSVATIVDFDYSTTCFGAGIFGGDVKRAVYSKYYLQLGGASVNASSAATVLSPTSLYKTVYITPLGDTPALPTSSSLGCAAFAGNLSSSSSSSTGSVIIPSYFVSNSESEPFLLSSVITRGTVQSGNYSVNVSNVGLDANASTLFFASAGSVCKGDTIYTVDTDILCSAYRHGLINFGDSNKELIVDVQTVSSSSSSSGSGNINTTSVLSMFGTWRRGQRSVYSGDYRFPVANYVTCMSTRLSSSSSSSQNSSSSLSLLPTCTPNYQKFENMCLQPIHYLRQRNQVVGTNPFSANSDAMQAAVAAGVVNSTSTCLTSFVLSPTSPDQSTFIGGSKAVASIGNAENSSSSSPSSSRDIMIKSNPFSVSSTASSTPIPSFTLSGVMIGSTSVATSTTSSSPSTFSSAASSIGTKMTVRCEFEEAALTRAAGLTLWSHTTDLSVVALMQFGCNWTETVNLFVSFIPAPPLMSHFISTCSFGVCGLRGVPVTDKFVMLVAGSAQEMYDITNTYANSSYPVNVSNDFAQLSSSGSLSNQHEMNNVTGAGRYLIQSTWVSFAGLFEGIASFTSSSSSSRTNEPKRRMQLATIGLVANTTNFLSTSRLGFETQKIMINATTTQTTTTTFAFVEAGPGHLPLGNATDFPTNIALNNQVPARYYYNKVLNATSGLLSFATPSSSSSSNSSSSISDIPSTGFGRYNKSEWTVPLAALHSGIVDPRQATSTSPSTSILKIPIWIRSTQPGTAKLPFVLGATARGIATATLASNVSSWSSSSTTTTMMPTQSEMESDWYFVSLNNGDTAPRVQIQPEYSIVKNITGTGDYSVDTPLSLAVVHAGLAAVDDSRYQVAVEIFPVTTPRSLLLPSAYGDMISQLSTTPNSTHVYMLHQSTVVPACRRPRDSTTTAAASVNFSSFGVNDWLVVDVRTPSYGLLGMQTVAGPAALTSATNASTTASFWHQQSLVSSALVQTGFAARGGAVARINISFGPAINGTNFPSVLLNTMLSRSATVADGNQTAFTLANASDCEFVSRTYSASFSPTKSRVPTHSTSLSDATSSGSMAETATASSSWTTWSVTHPSYTKTFSRSRSRGTISFSGTDNRSTRTATAGKTKSRTRTFFYIPPFQKPEFAIGDHIATPILWAAGPTSILAMLFGGSPVNGLYSTSALAVAEFSLCYRDNENQSLRFPESAWPGFTVGRPQGQHVRGALIANMCTMLGVGMTILAFGALKAHTKARFRRFRSEKRNRKQAKRSTPIAAFGGISGTGTGTGSGIGSFGGASLASNASFFLGPGAFVNDSLKAESGADDDDEDKRDFFDRATQEAWFPGSYILCSSLFLEGIVVSVTKLFILGPDIPDVVLCCVGMIMCAQLVVVAWTVVSRSFHAAASVRFCQSYVRVMDPSKHESVVTRFLRSRHAATIFIGNYCWCAKKGTEDSINNVIPGPARPAGLLVLPFRARNPEESGIIALAMRYFFVECVVALVIGIARGIQDPCATMMWIVAAATLFALLLQIRVRPYNIPFYNTTAAWTNAAICAAAFCIAAFHNGYGGERVRMVGEIMAMMAALGGALPFILFVWRSIMMWLVTADVAPIGLHDAQAKARSKKAVGAAAAGAGGKDLSSRSGESSSVFTTPRGDVGPDGLLVQELDEFSANNNNQTLSSAAAKRGPHGGAVGDAAPDEFELADMLAHKQPVNWPLKPADEISLPPIQHFEDTDDNLFLRRKDEYRHHNAIFHDEQERKKMEDRSKEKELDDQRERERQEKVAREAQELQAMLEKKRINSESTIALPPSSTPSKSTTTTSNPTWSTREQQQTPVKHVSRSVPTTTPTTTPPEESNLMHPLLLSARHPDDENYNNNNSTYKNDNTANNYDNNTNNISMNEATPSAARNTHFAVVIDHVIQLQNNNQQQQQQQSGVEEEAGENESGAASPPSAIIISSISPINKGSNNHRNDNDDNGHGNDYSPPQSLGSTLRDPFVVSETSHNNNNNNISSPLLRHRDDNEEEQEKHKQGQQFDDWEQESGKPAPAPPSDREQEIWKELESIPVRTVPITTTMTATKGGNNNQEHRRQQQHKDEDDDPLDFL